MAVGLAEHDKEAWGRLPFSLTIADISQDDEPLIYVNRAFEQMTGYSRSSVVGRNCRFLQGEKTDPGAVERLAKAIRNCEEVEETIYNYRADGEGFWNHLLMGPLEDQDEKCRYFVGIQVDMGQSESPDRATELDRQLAEVQHRVKNHLAMIVSMIRIQSSQAGGVGSQFDSLSRRVEALQLLYQEMDIAGAAKATDKIIPLGAYLGRIASAINHIDGRGAIKVNVQADTVDVPVETAGRIGLLVSEVLTNALQHAFSDRASGVVQLRSSVMSGEQLRVTVEDDGRGIPEDCDWPNEGNLGSRIVRQLVQGLGAELNVTRGGTGTIVNIDIPLSQQKTLIADERTKD
ncbi:blue-light-activated histidine kinase [Erythrobacter litoralis]|uniref:Blue-light-activated histidine kinase 2 n=3 Tax=Erythrobacter litoralis (strain HTCC2594) TaxID=314225 RepID=LVHK2_ERYLH|nr:blue-light-activated histidine kinase [Erythrobacter litoralis]Q2NB77.1 RecName: Full=Blue-light-activated histidine kinase 2; AltName: Full=EL346-LOV-histidine kinase; Short=EL346-LOV-HK [Erythrobacter litoralis HTCC2594]ABC63064.1 sensory box histidine kinase [Erythrobacter litoralis HTCC2594]